MDWLEESAVSDEDGAMMKRSQNAVVVNVSFYRAFSLIMTPQLNLHPVVTNPGVSCFITCTYNGSGSANITI